MSEYPQFGRGTAVALAAGLALVAAGCGDAAQAKKAAADAQGLPVNVVSVQRIELRREVEAVGTLAAKDQAVISAEVAGRVARLGADMGDRVKAGSPLVFLDAEKLRYRADEQQAALDQTRARLGGRGTDPPADLKKQSISCLSTRNFILIFGYPMFVNTFLSSVLKTWKEW